MNEGLEIFVNSAYRLAIDTLTKNSTHAFSYRQAAARNVNSLKTWLAGTKTIGRPETSYLDNRGDLMNLVECDDGAIERMGWFLEDLKVWFQTSVQPVRTPYHIPNF